MNTSHLSARLREETTALHRVAERSGVMRELLHGRLDRRVYCRLLRNLHALYAALEAALDHLAHSAFVAPIRFPQLFRTEALREDLEHLDGAAWESLAVAHAASAYVARLREIADTQPALLAAHAYVRYMGDLSGGQLLRGIVCRSYALKGDAGAAFYRFPAGVEAQEMKLQFRTAIDALPLDANGARELIDEGKAAFVRHAQLFEELAALPAARMARSRARRYKPSPP